MVNVSKQGSSSIYSSLFAFRHSSWYSMSSKTSGRFLTAILEHFEYIYNHLTKLPSPPWLDHNRSFVFRNSHREWQNWPRMGLVPLRNKRNIAEKFKNPKRDGKVPETNWILAFSFRVIIIKKLCEEIARVEFVFSFVLENSYSFFVSQKYLSPPGELTRSRAGSSKRLTRNKSRQVADLPGARFRDIDRSSLCEN